MTNPYQKLYPTHRVRITETPSQESDRLAGEAFHRAGTIADGLNLDEIGEDAHAVANVLWSITAYLQKRSLGEIK